MKPFSLVLVARLAVGALATTASTAFAIGFDPPTAIPLGNSSTTGAHGMATGDLDHDGRSDLVVVDANSNVVDVLLQQASGGFAPVARIPSAAGPFSVALADLNQDTHLDVVVGNNVASSVSVYLGDGTGAFLPRVDYALPSPPAVVAVGEVTTDGKLDVVASAGMRVCILPGNGLGQLDPVTTIETAPYSQWGLALSDLDADGDVDIVSSYNGPFYTFRNRGGGVFSQEYDGTSVTNHGIRALAVGNVTGDSYPDVVGASEADNGLFVYGNDFGYVTQGPLIATGADPWSVAIADIDQDGSLDVVTSHFGANTISVLKGTGTGLGPVSNFSAGQGPISVALLDVNGDGDLDVAETDYFTGSVTLHVQNQVVIPPEDSTGFTSDADWHLMPPLGGVHSHSAAYDESRQYLWVFGGSTLSSALWVFDFSSGAMTSREIVISGTRPARRNNPSLFYDAAQDRLILFGGSGLENDLWTLSLSGAPTWSQWLPAGTGPTVQSLKVFDSTRGRILVFGGAAGNEVWVLSLGSSPAWTQIVPAGSLPPARTSLSGVYDPLGDRLIIAGGRQGSTVLSDTWELSLASPAWTLLSSAGASDRAFAAVFDRARNRMVRFGIGSPCASTQQQTLTLAPPYTWTTSGSFPVRYGYAFAYDPVMDRVLLHGGHNSGGVCVGGRFIVYDELMALGLGSMTWTTLPPPATGARPSPRMRPLIGYIPARQEAILVGGISFYSSLNDVWRLDLAGTPAWQPLTVTGAGQPNAWGTSMIYDPVRDRMVQFGGGPYGFGAPQTADVYSLSLQPTPAWQPVSVSGSPPPGRCYHSAIYDPVGDRMIVFGGSDSGTPWPFPTPGNLFNDVWQLTLSPPMTWSQIVPSGTPPPGHWEHSAFYDPIRHRMVVHGGGIAGGAVADTWELSLGPSSTWTQIFPLGSPPIRGSRESHAVYVSSHDALVIADGGKTYALNFAGTPTWSRFPNMTPFSRHYAATLYDSGRDRMLSFGGDKGQSCGVCGPESWNDLWILNFTSGPVSVEPPVLDQPTIALRAYPNPSAATTTLEFTAPARTLATVRIYDVSGRLVRDLFTGTISAGAHRATWDGRDAGGHRVTPGLFFVRAHLGDVEYRRTVIRVR